LVVKVGLLVTLIPAGFLLCGAFELAELKRLTRSLPTLTADLGGAA